MTKSIENTTVLTGTDKRSIFTIFILGIVALSKISSRSCTTWIFGQEDMPEELL